MSVAQVAVDAELRRAFTNVPDATRLLVHDVVERLTPALVAAFYDHFTSHPEGQTYLTDPETTERLRGTLMVWMAELFSAAPQHPQRMADSQRHIGRFHARSSIPIHLVSEGVSLVQRTIIHALGHENLTHEELTDAVLYVTNVLTAATGVMTFTYWRQRERAASNDVAYRLFALNQDLSREGEGQKAALLGWSYNVLRSLYVAKTPEDLQTMGLARSEFGLWVTYKVGLLFEGTDISALLTGQIAKVDNELLPAILEDMAAERDISPALAALHAGVTEILSSLEVLFHASRSSNDVEDPLTRVLNRRFLPSIISYELRVAHQTGRPMSVLFLDIDHFKHINDTFGHAAGDSVLQAIARVLEEASRLSDVIFRYGGEEFLVLMGDTDTEQMLIGAERLRQKIENTPIRLPDGNLHQITVSIGAAQYAGHPDYEELLRAADAALYRAKRNGRNRIEVADAPHHTPAPSLEGAS
ncbi:putative signalling protein, GGDEF family [Gluconacetobacter diazotrophicus PA1 5]|uniref:Diguanylate cyclase DosC n=2 Tax=Gluconacetobacter diazotrophicus TaxID=33996 RepID=A9HLL2_GLUDA|nr:diguanylate cyclase [Gluconacetobacter diazotrophicus]CAP56182.1 putative signalling protein, GGDEF family [Gluconacetobacter diazotrophicus PA1 5]